MIKVLSEKINKDYGYIVRKEQIDHIPEDQSEEPLIVETAYTPDGQRIGTAKDAFYLYGRGIIPERIDETCCVCAIGFCEKENKWYGWSHRAMYGFTVGSKVKKGDIAYRANCETDFVEDITSFWSGTNTNCVDIKSEITQKDGIKQVYTSWVYDQNTPNVKIKGTISGVYTQLPDEYGRGEWQAKTLQDAKQMAIDFVNGAS